MGMGVNMIRFYAEDNATLEVINSLNTANKTPAYSIPLHEESVCNGYWYGKPGLEFLIEA